MTGTMPLDQALRILAEVHTRDDSVPAIGFQVLMGATPSWSTPWSGHDEYIEAWRTVRQHLHMSVGEAQ